jgi:hypothetical protein
MSEPVLEAPKFLVFGTLAQSFSLLFRNITPFGLIAMLITSPTYIYLLTIDPYELAFRPELSFVAYLGYIDFVFYYLLAGILVFGVFEGLRGQSVSLARSFARGLTSLLPVIGIVVVMIAVLAIFFAIYIAVVFGIGASSGMDSSGSTLLALILGLVVAGVPALYVFSMLWVVVPAAVVEGRTLTSFGRSLFLTKGSRWRVVGLIIMLFIIMLVINLVSGFIGDLFGSWTGYILVAWVGTAIAALINSVVITVAYHRLRLAKDGVGEDQVAAVFD